MMRSFSVRQSVDLSQVVLIPLAESTVDRLFTTRESDLSQIGTKRLEFSKDMHLELPTSFIVLCESIPGFNDVKTDDLELGIYVRKLGKYNDLMTKDMVRELQAALCPVENITLVQVVGTDEFGEYMDEMDDTEPTTIASFVTLVNQVRLESVSLNAIIQAAASMDDAASVVDDKTKGVLFNREAFNDLSYESVLELVSYIPITNDERQQLLDRICLLMFVRMQNNTNNSPQSRNVRIANYMRTLLTTRVFIQDIFTRLRIKLFRLPNRIQALLNQPGYYDDAQVVIFRYHDSDFVPPGEGSMDYIPHEVDGYVFQDAVDPPLTDMLMDLNDGIVYDSYSVSPANCLDYAYYAFACLQSLKVATPGVDSKAKAMFGCSRSRVVRQNFQHGNVEVNAIDGRLVYARKVKEDPVVKEAVCALVEKMLADPIEVDIYHCGSVASFMKAGHHATAAGLAHTVVKLLQSMTVVLNVDIAVVSKLIPYGSYYGFHCASIILVFSFLADKAQRDDLSFAISRRLYVSPPGTVGFNVAMIFLCALDRAQFFHTINRKAEFDDLLIEYDKWYQKAPQYAPYALYMYGITLPEDTTFRNKMSTWLGYCAALPEVMPTSTLRFSAALARESAAAASNDIIGPILANSYGTAIATSATRSMREIMDKKVLRIGGV